MSAAFTMDVTSQVELTSPAHASFEVPRADFCRIARDVRFGENVRLFGFVNLYGCSIGDNSRVGSFVADVRSVMPTRQAPFRRPSGETRMG